jgi:putative redox protein
MQLGAATMECRVSWLGNGGMAFSAETGSGHLIKMDGPPEAGGQNSASRPMELILAGTGGCSAFDVVLILQKARQEISACDVKLTAERAETEPKVFTKINLHFTVKGKNLDPVKVERAVKLSHEKYCSATTMLAKTAEITYSIDVLSDE